MSVAFFQQTSQGGLQSDVTDVNISENVLRTWKQRAQNLGEVKEPPEITVEKLHIARI